MAVVAGCGISELARVVGTGFTDRKVEALPGSGRRDLRQLGEVGSIRRPPVKARMRSACVVEVEIPADRSTGLGDGAVSSEGDLLVLDRSPEPLDEDVVAPSTLAVHADPDPIAGQYPGEDFAGELPGFNRSSQRLPEPIAALRREPRRASSIRVSFAACCSGPQLLRPDHQRCGRPGPSPLGNTAAATHWCSRSSHVATGCADRRSTLAVPCRPAVVRAAPSPTPGPRSASDGAAQARW